MCARAHAHACVCVRVCACRWAPTVRRCAAVGHSRRRHGGADLHERHDAAVRHALLQRPDLRKHTTVLATVHTTRCNAAALRCNTTALQATLRSIGAIRTCSSSEMISLMKCASCCSSRSCGPTCNYRLQRWPCVSAKTGRCNTTAATAQSTLHARQARVSVACTCLYACLRASACVCVCTAPGAARGVMEARVATGRNTPRCTIAPRCTTLHRCTTLQRCSTLHLKLRRFGLRGGELRAQRRRLIAH